MDRQRTDVVRHVSQGTFLVASDPGTIFSTVLGSCVAACLHDPTLRIGGMNHFLLPSDASGTSGHARFGVNLMEQLINELFKHGALKSRLIAKVFGGANVAIGGSTVGARNGAFVKSFLEREGIACVAESLGGDRARRLRFRPFDGRVSQLLINPAEVRSELSPPPRPTPPPVHQEEPEIWG